MSDKYYIVQVSGGKDSFGCVVWAMKNLQPHQWEMNFCDTEWESEITYQYLDYMEQVTGKKIVRLKHDPFPITDDERQQIRDIFGKDCIFAEMVLHKGRFPSTKARFCTEKLKSEPAIDSFFRSIKM